MKKMIFVFAILFAFISNVNAQSSGGSNQSNQTKCTYVYQTSCGLIAYYEITFNGQVSCESDEAYKVAIDVAVELERVCLWTIRHRLRGLRET